LGKLFVLSFQIFKLKAIMQNLYDFKAKSISGKEINMIDFEGKALIVVNTASKCGLTPQYEGLEQLYQKYKNDGLLILGFPCNQFGNQEPGNEESISEGCLLNYGVSFPMFSKIDVNGKNAHPIFKYLKKNLPGIFGTEGIKWNFTKFIIDKNGKPVKRFSPWTKPGAMEKDILKILNLEGRS
jgi:glutathione peroxidase